jgi:hypothetical protein
MSQGAFSLSEWVNPETGPRSVPARVSTFNNALMFGTGNNATGTPLDYFAQVNERAGGFGCDVAADKLLTLCPSWYGPDHDDVARRDCLSVDWPTDAPNWMNPPYGEPENPCALVCTLKKPCPAAALGQPCKHLCSKTRCPKRQWHTDVYIPGCVDFIRKAEEQRQRGAETWALLAARTDVEWFHAFIWDAESHRQRPGRFVEFIPGRLIFRRAGAPDPAPFPSMLVRFVP